jgi:hypothetical protein
MFGSTIAVTVDSVERTHATAWDSAYSKQIAAGNTAIRKVAITDGESLVRISHEEKNERKRHLAQMKETVVDSDGVSRTRSVHIVVEYDDVPAEKASANLLADGFVAALDSTFIDNLLADSL